MRSILFLTIVAAAGVAADSAQQTPPATEVFIRPLGVQSDPPWINISNSPGYDNQPSFLPDSSAVLFSSNRDGKQTDIYRYDIADRRLSQVTSTPEAEYSPTVTPDRKTFSVIRVEADGTQRLWRFDLDGSNPRLVLENVKPVGYHAWIDATHLALFVLGSNGSPATLQIADTATGTAEVVATGIGRSVLLRPGKGTVSYITSGEKRIVREYDPRTRTSVDLVSPLDRSQDAAWMTDGNQLLMASGTTLSMATFADNRTLGWKETASFTSHVLDSSRQRVAGITRLAVSPDGKWLAFVAELAK